MSLNISIKIFTSLIIVHKLYGGGAMKYDDKVSIMGIYQGRVLLFIMELFPGDFVCKKVLNLGKDDKLDIHSIINSGNSVYLTDSHNNKIYRYDYVVNEFSDVNVGRDPRHMAVDKDNMYVSNFESDNISVIDLSNFTLTESIPAGIKPHDILFNNKNDRLYACCYEESEIIEYSGNREITRRFRTEGKPMHMLILGDCLIVMTYFVNGNVYTKINFIDIKSGKIKRIILIEGLASDFDIDYKRQLLFIINIVDKNLYIVDIGKKEVFKKIFMGGYSESLTVGDGNVYVTNSKRNQITVIESDKLVVSKAINLKFTPGNIKVIN